MKFVPAAITQNIGRKVLTTKMNSPHIFFGMGVVGVVAGAVMACRATLKLEETIDEIKKDLDQVPEIVNTEDVDDVEYSQIYPDHARYKDISYIYLKAAGRFAVLYGPSILVGGTGIACLTGSHVQLTRRNAALTATVASLIKAYDAYRERVQAEIGEERELELYRAAHEEVIEMEGHRQVTTIVDPEGLSIYARFFDELNPNWMHDNETNRIFLQCQQNFANDRLKSRGYIFLNEVYDSLGMERTKVGQVVGWTIYGDGDHYVDFGIFRARSNRFVAGIEPSIILDFNVDGLIHDKIKDW